MLLTPGTVPELKYSHFIAKKMNYACSCLPLAGLILLLQESEDSEKGTAGMRQGSSIPEPQELPEDAVRAKQD